MALTAVILLVALFVYLFRDYFNKDLPPIPSLPWMLRLVKCYFNGSKADILAVFQELRAEYGSVFVIPTAFTTPFVFINSHKLIKEVHKSPAFFGRPNAGVAQFYFGETIKGIVLHDDEKQWSEIRHFTFRKLKDHGTGKNAFDELCRQEVVKLVEKISKTGMDKPTCTEDLFKMPMMNVFWNVVAGDQMDLKVQEMAEMQDSISEVLSNRKTGGNLLILLIVILGSVSSKLVKWTSRLAAVSQTRSFFVKYSKSARSAFKPDEISNFTDAFIEKINLTTNRESMFYGINGEENLSAVAFELVIGGVGSSITSIQWTLLYLAIHREMLNKVHQEIDSVLEGRLPSFDDKQRMPYVTAVMLEVSRIATLLPFGIPHKALEDVFLEGYKIQKGSAILSNFMALHNDADIWGDPHVFRPERFLSPDCSTIIKYETLIPFGVGKRSCPAEYLAKHNLFIFIAGILQRFTVSVDKPVTLDCKGLTFKVDPPQHKLIFSRRIPNIPDPTVQHDIMID